MKKAGKTISDCKILLVLIAGAAATLAGCFPLSLHPLYSDENVVFESGLLGTWAIGVNESIVSNESIVFETGEDKNYIVTYHSDQRSSRLEVHLVRLGQHYFADIYPEDHDLDEIMDQGYLPIIPMHLLFAVELNGDVLRMGVLDPDWLNSRIESEGMDIPYIDDPDDPGKFGFFTASTEQLQRSFLKYAEDKDAFNWVEWERQKQ